ncbi:MAG: IS3 family transposase, partial [Candidatus Aminicenantes bacterium]|nr:IS3 family transposase [Candidatus Aminicenantes bacterium]
MEKAAFGKCPESLFQEERPGNLGTEKADGRTVQKDRAAEYRAGVPKEKVQAAPEHVKKDLVEKESPELSVRRQCEILSLNRSSLYYERIVLSAEDQAILDEMDRIYLDFPVYGSRRISRELKRRGFNVGKLRARTLMRILGVEAIYPRKRLTYPDKEHQICPYLLRDVAIDRPNLAWVADITYIRLKHGFVYLMAVMDLFSRYIVSWRISNTLEPDFCCKALKEALEQGKTEYFNTDQGAQFTSRDFTSILKSEKIQISMDGKGRVIDNIFIERFWRTLKYEEVYTKAYDSVWECKKSIGAFIDKYNAQRLHQSLK